jgi:hypothetical protein
LEQPDAVATPEVVSEDRPQKKQKTGHGSDLIGSKRREAACLLVEDYIELDFIKPSDLRDTVEPSGLVEKQTIMEVYKRQAIKLQEKSDLRNSRGVFEARIGCRKKIKAPRLRCNEMKRGVHTWSYEVEIMAPNSLLLGVVAAALTRGKGKNEHFGISCAGETYRTNIGYQGGFPNIVAGDVVKFTLDLTDIGTLSATVIREDGRQEHSELFNNMLMHEGQRVERSFKPRVDALKSPVKIRFLGFRFQGNA